MLKRRLLLAVLLAAAGCNFLWSQNERNSVNFWTQMPNDQLARQITDEMTDAELLSQTFMFGWAGAEPPELLYQWVERGLGSVKVFGWNTDDIYLVAKSVSSLQHEAAEGRFQIPLFVATDQEGGWIRHVKGDTSITPGNMAIGAGGYPVDSWKSAYYISREIKTLGINMNFAPTVDLFTDHDSSIIGTRSFGDDPDKTGILGAAFVSGSEAAGVLSTAKHFPGHGDTSLDSHGKLPVINIDFNTFKSRELTPYLYLIKEKVPAVMSGHLSFPLIETSGAPASLSHYFLTDLLRNQLGYEGLIITDDMMMVGATVYAGTMSNAFKMALEAGNDIILSSTTAKLNEALWYKNLELMTLDKNFRERVKDAACRVIKAKLDYFKSGNAAPLYPDPNTIDSHIPDREGEKFFLEQACRSVTVEKQGSLPLTADKAGRVLLMGSLTSFFKAGKQRWPDAGEFHYTYETGPNETQWVLDNLPSVAPGYDTVIISVSSENHVKIAEYFKGSGKKVVILCNMTPTLTEKLQWADSILLGYSWRCDYSLKAMLGAVNGEYVPTGTKPYN
ncbi:beta-N-acetylhexosaminidase [Treponema bryantii]|uniref:beta-N-acetylhexosaminidase n=1 Tax=Treponema bryantii TaxID=163 RepID=A0A1H9E8B1_9SPIR|nr:glycoside hydrolase family 3 protein [Treponema bryantii]BDC94302.1 glycosyl hydrolase [Treponema bryantii]SEQ21857.1 beta-N-acetylhexosaminidase [Treponema bryantii]